MATTSSRYPTNKVALRERGAGSPPFMDKNDARIKFPIYSRLTRTFSHSSLHYYCHNDSCKSIACVLLSRSQANMGA